nr:MAG TPA: hypothetical protein [Caudoviricetes sp.]
MSEIETFKIDEEFDNIDDLYDFILENVEFIGKSCGIRIEKPMRERPFCITGFEEKTKRQILFYHAQENLPENIGELIILAGAFKADIVVYLVSRINVTLLEPMNWLHSICRDKTQFILGEVKVCTKRSESLD